MKTLVIAAVVYISAALLPPAHADIKATVSTASVGGGEFQYSFTIDNTSGTIPISGLLIEGGLSVFGLDPSSTIGAPPGWGFLAPLMPFDDLLSYFSLAPAADVPVGGTLGGFTFDSATNPGSALPINLIFVGDDSSQTPYQITPEPSSPYLLAAYLATVSVIFAAIEVKRREELPGEPGLRTPGLPVAYALNLSWISTG